jgi:DNA-binding transcriptional LysR family regulator
MDIRHLRHFIAVAEELHFARAAQRVHIAQSPLSRSIKALELQLGVQLLERTTRTTRLTAAGRVFHMESMRVIEAIERAKARAREMASGHRGSLRIATADGIAHARLTQLLTQYRVQEFEVELQLYCLPMAQLINDLHASRLDIGIGLPILPHHYDLSVEPLWPDHPMAVLPASHPLATSEQLTLSDLGSLPVVLGRAETWQGVDQLIAPFLEPGSANATHYATGHDSMLMMVRAGFGVGFSLVSQMGYTPCKDLKAIPLKTPLPPLQTCAFRVFGQPPELLVRFIERAKRLNHL